MKKKKQQLLWILHQIDSIFRCISYELKSPVFSPPVLHCWTLERFCVGSKVEKEVELICV